MRLIVGLGNPGPKYAAHRHNVGFMVVEGLATRLSAGSGESVAFRQKFHGAFAKTRLVGKDLLLLMPQTFMNLSGRSVREAMHFFKLGLGEVLVVHDELDLAFGALRIKVGGGTAGHNGLKSIVESCAGADFCRLRVGIGRPRSGAVQRHVLSDFSSEESAQLPDVLQSAAAAALDVVERGPQAAMNRHNRSGPS